MKGNGKIYTLIFLKRGCIVTVAITPSVRQILPAFILVSTCPVSRTVAEGCVVGDWGGVPILCSLEPADDAGSCRRQRWPLMPDDRKASGM